MKQLALSQISKDSSNYLGVLDRKRGFQQTAPKCVFFKELWYLRNYVRPIISTVNLTGKQIKRALEALGLAACIGRAEPV